MWFKVLRDRSGEDNNVGTGYKRRGNDLQALKHIQTNASNNAQNTDGFKVKQLYCNYNRRDHKPHPKSQQGVSQKVVYSTFS